MQYVLWAVFLDAGLAVGLYLTLRALGASTYTSLLVGTAAAGLRVLWVLAATRRFEPFAAFVALTFAVGLATSLLTGDERFLLLKGSIGTAVTGLLFVAGRFGGRPLLYHAAVRLAPAERPEWERRWAASPGFRRLFVDLSLVWGAAFLAEAVVRIPFVYLLPVDVMAAVSPLVTPSMITVLLFWTLWYGPRREARVRGPVPPVADD